MMANSNLSLAIIGLSDLTSSGLCLTNLVMNFQKITGKFEV